MSLHVPTFYEINHDTGDVRVECGICHNLVSCRDTRPGKVIIDEAYGHYDSRRRGPTGSRIGGSPRNKGCVFPIWLRINEVCEGCWTKYGELIRPARRS